LGGDSSHSTDRPIHYLRAFGFHVFIRSIVICAMGAKIPLLGRPGDWSLHGGA